MQLLMAPTYITRSDASPGSSGLVLRALRDDVPVRFYAFSPEAIGPESEAYEVVAEDGDVDGAGGVRLVEALAGVAELKAWAEVHRRFRGRQGYLGTRVHRGDRDCVVLMRWSSPLMYQRAMQQPEIAAAAGALGFERRAALYLAG
jgi:hypothetical protein